MVLSGSATNLKEIQRRQKRFYITVTPFYIDKTRIFAKDLNVALIKAAIAKIARAYLWQLDRNILNDRG